MGSISLYGGIIIITSIFAECSVRVENKLAKIYFAVLMLFIPSFFAGVRYGIGTDYFNYVIIYEQSRDNIKNRIEIGYTLLNKVISMLGGNQQTVFFVVSMLTLLFIYLTLLEHRDKFSVGIGMLVYMLGNYQVSFNNIRQLFAISILLFSFKYVFRKNFIKFIVCILFASTIHTSSFFFIPVYFMYFIVEKKSRMTLQFIIWGVIMVSVLFANVVLMKLIDIFPILYGYGEYLNNPDAQTYSHILKDISNLPYIIPGIVLYKAIRKFDNRFVLYYMLLVIGFIIQFASRGLFVTISIRASIVFFSSFTLVVPYYIKILNSIKLIAVSYTIMILLIAIWLIFLFAFNNNETVPYQWIFSF